jgi:hypothetical protein
MQILPRPDDSPPPSCTELPHKMTRAACVNHPSLSLVTMTEYPLVPTVKAHPGTTHCYAVEYKGNTYRIPYANSRDGERQNPHSKILCDERGYDFHPDKKYFCPPTPEALEVVKSFHWGAYFVVFSDGSVYATKSVVDGNCGWFAGDGHKDSVPGAKVDGKGITETFHKEFGCVKINDFTARWSMTWKVNGRKFPSQKTLTSMPHFACCATLNFLTNSTFPIV